MSKEVIYTESAMKPWAGYSQAVGMKISIAVIAEA
jgi:hypothetical protein